MDDESTLISCEYQTLREELLQSKKYVFERPLLIITLSIALIQFLDKHLLGLILFTAVGLLTFNLWFTINRMVSITRISAYIQLVLEERKYGKWIGWESSLRQYRIWKQKHIKELNALLNSKIDKEAIPKAQGYYKTIYYMHVGVVSLSTIGSIANFVTSRSYVDLLYLILTALITILFLISAINSRPNKMIELIEKHRAIWQLVFEDIGSLAEKAESEF